MKAKLARIGFPVLVLAASAAAGIILIQTAPTAERLAPEVSPPVVEVLRVEPQSYAVTLESRGTVTPRTQTSVVAEVSGRVVTMADELRSGGFFEMGELMLQIDPRNYENAVTIAHAELAQAELTLQEEVARGAQAKEDWKRLGLDGEPDALVQRRPQLDSARAAAAAADARLDQARIDLSRTRIEAPYASRVLEKSVDVGQYVSPGTVLSRIYAVDYVEIRLPISNDQLRHVDLPESYRDTDSAPAPVPVRISAEIGGRTHAWQAQIVRTEGGIDTETRQWFAVAQVDDPYALRDGRPPLKVGQFVTAQIQGRRITDAYVLPRAALRPGGEVVAVTPDRLIDRRSVEVMWETRDEVVVRGLEPGDEIVLGAAHFAVQGTRVRVAGEEAPGSADRLRTNNREPG